MLYRFFSANLCTKPFSSPLWYNQNTKDTKIPSYLYELYTLRNGIAERCGILLPMRKSDGESTDLSSRSSSSTINKRGKHLLGRMRLRCRCIADPFGVRRDDCPFYALRRRWKMLWHPFTDRCWLIGNFDNKACLKVFYLF